MYRSHSQIGTNFLPRGLQQIESNTSVASHHLTVTLQNILTPKNRKLFLSPFEAQVPQPNMSDHSFYNSRSPPRLPRDIWLEILLQFRIDPYAFSPANPNPANFRTLNSLCIALPQLEELVLSEAYRTAYALTHIPKLTMDEGTDFENEGGQLVRLLNVPIELD